MECGHTHIIVPLQTWYAIKEHVEILEQKGSEVIEMSQKGCEVNEISGVVKSMMETVDKENSAFSTCEPDVQEFEEGNAVADSVSELFPQMQAACIPEVLKKHPVPPTSPPPRKLLVKAHGPFASMVLPQDNRPWRSTPYSKDSRGSTSSSAASTWYSHDFWS